MLIAVGMHEERMALVRETDRRAEAARADADAARCRVGFLDRLAGVLGVRTAAVRDLDEAEARMVRAEAARDDGRELRADLARIDGHARIVVREREVERVAWSRQPEVAAAWRELHGNDLVRAAIAGGDRRIGYLAAADLPAAREIVHLREADRAALEDRQRREAMARAQARAEPDHLATVQRQQQPDRAVLRWR